MKEEAGRGGRGKDGKYVSEGRYRSKRVRGPGLRRRNNRQRNKKYFQAKIVNCHVAND